jgi:2-methylisocitrate lyase-like PEP mutase family enzyme
MSARAEQAARADELRRLHDGPHPLVLGNAWDAASARVFAREGFPAIATTSGGVAESLGYDDHEGAPIDAVFAATARIVAATSLPVTADLEAGYGLAPDELARRAIEAGVAGLNIEDSDYRNGGLVDVRTQAARLVALKQAARELGVDLVVNARIDVYVRRSGPEETWLAEAVRRGRAYRAAGADCVYPILLDDERSIAALVADIAGPVNILLHSSSPPLARLADLGVRRISVGSSYYRAAMAHLAADAKRLRDDADALSRGPGGSGSTERRS